MTINKVTLLGNLGQDPEVRQTTNGNAMTILRVATSERWTDSAGQRQERTEWHRVVLFGRLAEIAGQYLRKGARVYLEGRLQAHTWLDQDGKPRRLVDIVVSYPSGKIVMLGGPASASAHPEQSAKQSATQQTAQPQQLQQKQNPQNSTPQSTQQQMAQNQQMQGQAAQQPAQTAQQSVQQQVMQKIQQTAQPAPAQPAQQPTQTVQQTQSAQRQGSSQHATQQQTGVDAIPDDIEVPF